MPVQISFQELHPHVIKAVGFANQLLNDPMFYSNIAAKGHFDLSTASAAVVAEVLQSSNLVFAVELFYPNLLTFKYRKTLAYTDSRFPNRLFLNFKKLNRTAESIVATIIHESVHAVDDATQMYTFGHGNNSAVGKENTAPYWIGNLAHSMLLNGAPLTALVFDQEEEEEEEQLA
jgi:hypothetical protein